MSNHMAIEKLVRSQLAMLMSLDIRRNSYYRHGELFAIHGMLFAVQMSLLIESTKKNFL